MNYPSSDEILSPIAHCARVVPVISTKHITAADGGVILTQGHPYVMDIDPSGEWSLISTLFHMWEGGDASEPLRQLLKMFHSLGYPWIILDCDGDVIEGLPVFDW